MEYLHSDHSLTDSVLAPVLRCHGIFPIQARPNVPALLLQGISPGTAISHVLRHHHPCSDRVDHHQRLLVHSQLSQGLEASHQQKEDSRRRENDRAVHQCRRSNAYANDD